MQSISNCSSLEVIGFADYLLLFCSLLCHFPVNSHREFVILLSSSEEDSMYNPQTTGERQPRQRSERTTSSVHLHTWFDDDFSGNRNNSLEIRLDSSDSSSVSPSLPAARGEESQTVRSVVIFQLWSSGPRQLISLPSFHHFVLMRLLPLLQPSSSDCVLYRGGGGFPG